MTPAWVRRLRPGLDFVSVAGVSHRFMELRGEMVCRTHHDGRLTWTHWTNLTVPDGRPDSPAVAVRCETCRFFYQLRVDWGQCHRRSPVAPGKDDPSLTMWPLVHVDDACGDYAPPHQGAGD